MIEWWLSRFLADSEQYKLWHPKDHVTSTWDEEYFKTPYEQRIDSHYCGHTHIVTEYLGGKLCHLHIHFISPTEAGFDVAKLKKAGITLCLLGRVHQIMPMIGNVAVSGCIYGAGVKVVMAILYHLIVFFFRSVPCLSCIHTIPRWGT